ncbi:hypothetical protein BGZ60DRAFT_195392 [Tricladium varicosporioides]|nr:hypothetical protein BGZ60DRAFT_195392 [Hymenoscyphus varicosporioides]
MSSSDNLREEEMSGKAMPGYDLLEQHTFYTLVHSYNQAQPQSSTPTPWKYFWYQRINLIWFQKLGWGWDKIEGWFRNIGISKNTIDGWKKMESRATGEINALGRVMAADKNGRQERLNGLMRYMSQQEAESYDDTYLWDRVCLEMRTYSSTWTQEKLRFVWCHGVAVLGEFDGLGPRS